MPPLALLPVRVVTDLSVSPWPGERAVITVGAYDGVHRGHQAVIAEVRRIADASGARSAVVTFDRHPASVVRPESAPKLLTDLDQKLELLAATGVGATVVVRFDEAQSREEPMSFAQRVLVDCLGTSVVVVGEDFHFGHGREGNVATLRELGAVRDFEVLPLSLVGRSDGPDEPISSTAIRRAMAGGQVELAATLLGHPFEARGVVVQGDQRGRLLGFPTANVEVPIAVCVPADGVYAGWYHRPDGSRHAVPSTSVGGPPSTSTPSTRCSRRTCSTSTAICTPKRRGSSSPTSCAASASSMASMRSSAS